MSGHASALWSDEHKRWCCYKFAGEVGEIGSWMTCGNHWVQFHAIEPFFKMFFPDSDSYLGYLSVFIYFSHKGGAWCHVVAVVFAAREVLGPTVGSLVAVLGAVLGVKTAAF